MPFIWPEFDAHWLILMIFGAGVIVGVYVGWPIGLRIGRRKGN